ncbi:hypothetical protein NKG05_23670 [Oerskovia sp. M15]
MPVARTSAGDRVAELAATFGEELVAVRRDIHAHPEVSRAETRTTALLADRLRAAGLSPRLLPGTGLLCDIGDAGPGQTGACAGGSRSARTSTHCRCRTGASCPGPRPPGRRPRVRARRARDRRAGAGLVLAALAERGELSRPVRLIFQPPRRSSREARST